MRRKLAFGAIATLTSLAFLVLAIEGLVRFIVDDGMQYDLEMWKYAREVKRISGDPLIGHEHAPDRHAVLMGVDFTTNSKGLRDREFAYARTPGKLRILMLGDSMTVGWGVNVLDTFAKRIERMYADRGIDAEVINTGVGNYNTIQEVEFFLTEGRKYRPDIVVLNFSFNDAEPVPSDRPPSFLERTCYSCIFVLGRFDTLMRRFSAGRDWTDYYLALYGSGEAKGWMDAKTYIARLAEFCRTSGIMLLVANLPELHDVRHYRLQRITALVQAAAEQNGVAFVDLLPYLKDRASADLWVTPPDPHPNALAHGLIAQGIFDALQRLHSSLQLK
jgi:lysophospholipase L1-like esterase